jgi:hypothetical protein
MYTQLNPRCHIVLVKLPKLIAMPPGVVTTILPALASLGTVAVIRVSESTAKLVALKFPKTTLVAPVKLPPVITTLVPVGPLEGVKLEITGATPNLPESVPPGVST